MGRQITRLPTSVVSHLRSSTILSNVAQIAEELVCNSLDAGATVIEVAVDGEACHMRVDDNGCGISRDDLTLLGQRHATSKLHCLDELERGVATLGFRGEALSSLCDLALVEITTRCRGMPNTYRKILKGSTTVSIGLCGEQRSYGTTVIVRDMFYNQPVRRRLLKSSHRKTLQSVKESVLRFVLIYPQVSFTVKDLARKEVLLHTKSAATLKSTLCDMFGEDMLRRLQEVNYAQGHFRITGFLSKTYHSHPSKALQYFYINRRFVLKTALHKLLNSWVGPNIDSHGDKCKDSLGQIGYGAGKSGKSDMASGKHLSPIFVLNMTCPPSEYDITFEVSKTLVEFKDWTPVASFLKCILEEIWGYQSIGKKHAHESCSEDSLKKTANNRDIHQHKIEKHHACSKEVFPSMAVRQALVQSDSRDPCCSNKDLISQGKAATSSYDIPEKPETIAKSSVPSLCLSGKEITGMAQGFERKSKDKQLKNIAKILQTDSDSDSDCIALPSSWHMTPCRQQKTVDQLEVPLRLQMDEPFPAILGSDWFSQGASSPELKEQHHSLSSSAIVKPVFLSDVTGPIIPEKDQCIRSSVASRSWSPSNSWSLTNTCWSPVHTSMEKFRNPELCATFTDADYGRYLSYAEDTDEKHDTQWWELDDPKHKTPLWSGSDDSTGSPRILDTSDFLPEVSSFCLDDTSKGVNLLQERKWAAYDSDHSGSKLSWMSRVQTKRQRLECFDGDDSGAIDDFFSAKSVSFHPDLDNYIGGVHINNSDGWNLNTAEAIDDIENSVGCSEKFIQATNGIPIFSTNGEYDLDAVQRHNYEIEVDSYQPRSKRRLELNFDNSSDNLKLLTGHYDKQEPSKENLEPSKETAVHLASPSQVRHTTRGHSGPPFYRPPRRHGAHVNPLSSHSTMKDIVNVAEDANVTQIEADPKCEISLESPRVSNRTRDRPKKGMECITNIQPETGRDCTGHSVQSSRLMDQDQLRKHRTVTDAEEVECPLDAVEIIRPTMEVDLHQRCKYRSTDVNKTGIEGAELPMDTVRAMFKEWSNPCMKKDDDILDISSGILASSNSSLLPGSITKDVLKHARVLQQVDTKFIASVACGVLLLIDQHAADERVRLEELRENVLGERHMKQISLLTGTQELALTFTEQQVLQMYRQQIQDWGWRFKIPSGGRSESSTRGMCKVLLSAVPSILGVSLTGADLTEYLRQLSDTQGSSAPPPAVIRLLNNKACRGAIMFGDTLLPAECSQLIEHLKKTRLCFQCAHGRPTMVPLVDLQALHKRFDHNFGNMNSDLGRGLTFPMAKASRGQWHGLQVDCKSNLERAKARWEQAQSTL